MASETTLAPRSIADGAPPTDLTISIVSHGHGAMLTALLGDLDRQPDLRGVPVVVTYNVPEAEVHAGFANLTVTVIHNPVPKGFGANHNAAFGHCRTRFFLILNPDIRLGALHSLTHLRDQATANPRIGVIAPRIVAGSGATEDAVRANLTPLALVERVAGHRRRIEPVAPSQRGRPFYWLAGMCLLANADAFREVAGFDERFFLYCEDYDLCARLYYAGYVIAVDDGATVVHDAQRASHRSLRHLRWHVGALLRVWTSAAYWRVVRTSPARGDDAVVAAGPAG